MRLLVTMATREMHVREMQIVRGRVLRAASLEHERAEERRAAREIEIRPTDRAVAVESVESVAFGPRCCYRRKGTMNPRVPNPRRVVVRDVRSLSQTPLPPPMQRVQRPDAQHDHRRAHQLVRDVADRVQVRRALRREEDDAHEREAEGVPESPP
jgi:hypothetical protein